METGKAPTTIGSPRSDGETPVDQVPGGKVKKYPSVGFFKGFKGPSLYTLFPLILLPILAWLGKPKIRDREHVVEGTEPRAL